MEATFKQLVAIEAVCAQIDRLDKLLAEFPAEEEVVAAGVRKAQAGVAEAKTALEHEEMEERRLESAMKDQEAKILKLNHQSGQVSSNEAYTALQNELDAAEAAKIDAETRALEHMEAIDGAKVVLSNAQAELARVESEAPETLADIAGRRSVVEKEREAQLGERAKLAATIDAKVMKRFDTVRAKKSPAIAVLEGKSCPQCKIVLPRMRLSEINLLQAIFDCSSCKRLLVPAKVFE